MSAFAKTVLQFQDQDKLWQKSNKRFYEQENSQLPHSLKSFASLESRFSNSSYIQSTYSTKIQPVIKIISKQTGITQVRRLIDYIAREAKEKEEHLSLEDDKGKSFDHKEQRESEIRKWQQDFFSKEAYKNQQWKLDLMDKLEFQRAKLLKIPDSKLTEPQKQKLENLTDQIDNQYYLKKEVNKETGQKELKRVIDEFNKKDKINENSVIEVSEDIQRICSLPIARLQMLHSNKKFNVHIDDSEVKTRGSVWSWSNNQKNRTIKDIDTKGIHVKNYNKAIHLFQPFREVISVISSSLHDTF